MHPHFRLTSAWLAGSAALLVALAGPCTVRAADNSAASVSYGTRNGAFEVWVAAPGPVSTKVSRYAVDAEHGTVDVVVDVSPASYDGQTKVIGFSRGQLEQVRVGQLSTSPAVMRIVVEASGTPHYDVVRSGPGKLTLRVPTQQAAFTLPPQEAVAAARAASQRHDVVLIAQTAAAKAAAPVRTQVTVQRSRPVAAHPVPHTVAMAGAQRPPARTATAARPVAPSKPASGSRPAVVAMATPNPWLPGGKYYCKVPSKHGVSAGAMASHEAAARRHAAAMAAPAMGMPFESRNVSLDVKNADILDVLRLLASQSGQNIVATQSVKGTVSVSLHDVPLTTALDLIVRTNGLDYRRLGNIYVVGTSDDLNKEFGSVGQEATQTVAFPIKYANPTDLGKQLSSVIPATSYTIDPRTDTVIVTGTPDIIQSARNFLALSDVPAPQVVFEVKVLDVTRDANSNVGVSWSGASPFDLFENCLACTAGQTVPVQTVSGNPIAPQPFTRNALFIQGTLNYLISHDEATVLANPRVAALDNQPANLLVGQTYPIVYYDPRSGQFQAQYIDIGVKIIITPVINTDGYITTQMHVERSSIVGLVQNFPILDNRKVESTLRVKDGDTIVLGGLLDDESTTTVNKVPLLGDIPILGAFFRNVQRTKTHEEVVFLITPHIVGDH
jgi:type IV pilus assembly protein PilQ